MSLRYGPMHLVLLNVVRALFFIWKGTSPCDKSAPRGVVLDEWQPQPYVLNDRQWRDIGNELLAARKKIPAALGRAPQNPSVQKLRASAWHSWMMMYSVPVLSGRLPDVYLDHWIVLIRAYDLCLKWQNDVQDLENIQSLLRTFVEDFKRLYIDCDDHPTRARLYSTNIHGLLHIHDQIKDCGPMFVWDESSTESYMGAIEPMARSGVKIDESAANATFLEEMVKMLGYARRNLTLPVGKQLTLSARAYETEFGYLLPVVEQLTLGELSNWERRQLRQYFNTLVGYRANIVIPNDLPVRKWARYQIKPDIQGRRMSGHKIGSVMSQRPGPITRASHWIRYQLIHSREDRPDLFYGEVQFFLSITVPDVARRTEWRRGSDGRLTPEDRSSEDLSSQDGDDMMAEPDATSCEHYLAYVRNWRTAALDEDSGNRRVKFLREGAYEFVELRSIDCAVGRLATFQADWVVSGSVHPVRADVEVSDDDESQSEGEAM
jgi:hypothetical protein